jgi:hypothetical protein
MWHHVIRVCIEGETPNGTRETHSTLIVVPASIYEGGLHHRHAFEHARAVGLEPPYRVMGEYEVTTCVPTHPRPRGRKDVAG